MTDNALLERSLASFRGTGRTAEHIRCDACDHMPAEQRHTWPVQGLIRSRRLSTSWVCKLSFCSATYPTRARGLRYLTRETKDSVLAQAELERQRAESLQIPDRAISTVWLRSSRTGTELRRQKASRGGRPQAASALPLVLAVRTRRSPKEMRWCPPRQ